MDGKKKSDEITRIEDLPNLEQQDDPDEEFQDLESMANDLGLKGDQDLEPSHDTKIDFDNSQDDFASTTYAIDAVADNSDEFFSSQDNYNFNDNEESFDTPSDLSAKNLNLNQEEQFDSDFESEFTSNLDQNFISDSFENISSPMNPSTEFDLKAEVTTHKLAEVVVDKTHSATIKQGPNQFKTPSNKEMSSSATEPKHSSENFSEVTSFIEHNAYGDFSAEGNPPFSIILKNLKFHEDAQEIMNILIELKVYTEDTREQLHHNLERGQLLISRLSEFAAITLCHKLRGFDLEILMGLTEEINPPKSYQSNDRGLTSKRSLLNNKKLFHTLKDRNNELVGTILTSTLPTIDGYKIVKNLGMITHVKLLNLEDIKGNIEDELIEHASSSYDEKASLRELQLARENILSQDSVSLNEIEEQFSKLILGNNKFQSEQSHNLNKTYENIVSELLQKIDQRAVNAVLGINFTITPINIDEYLSKGPKYQVICSGNMVHLEKI